MALTVSTDIMKYRESTSDPWKNLIIEPSGTTMYFPSQTVNTASNAEIFRITDGAITTQTVVVECTFASPSSITSDVTWTSYDGYIAFYGTCTSATTADVALGNATVPTPETPLSIAKGGTGASTAADAIANLCAGITEYTDSESTSSNSAINKVYTVTGNGYVIASCSVVTDTTSDVGWCWARIRRNTDAMAEQVTTMDTARAYQTGASVSCSFMVSTGDTISLLLQGNRNGTKTLLRTILAFGCTLTTS